MVEELRGADFEPDWHIVDTEPGYLARLHPALDVILSDYTMPQFDALRALRLLHDRGLDIPFIIVSGSIGEEIAVSAMREGVTDYLLKDRLGRLGLAVTQALEQKRLRERERRAEEALRASEKKFRQMADGAPVLIWTSGPDKLCNWFNKPWLDFTGRTLEQELGNGWAEGVHPEDYDRCFDTYARAFDARQPFQMEYRLRGRDGEYRWILDQAVPQHAGREFTGYIASCIDITERKRAEESLREQSHLAALGADVGLALIRSDTLRDMLQRCAESMVRNLAAAFARIWTLDEAEGVLELQASAGRYTHLDGPHSRIAVGQFKIGLIAQERRPHLTNDVCNDPCVSDRDWARREGMVAFAGYPLLVEDRLVGVMAMFARRPLAERTLETLGSVALQIALGIERKRAGKDLFAAQQRLKHVVASSPAVLYTLAIEGKDFRPTWISENVSEMMGYPVNDVHQPNWWQEHVHPEDLQRALAEIQNDLVPHGHLVQEHRFRHRDGKYRWVRSEMRLLRDAVGNLKEVVGSWSDITERKQLEDQFRQSQKMEAVGRLAGGVAHDFNNLLTIILGYAEFAQATLKAGDPVHEFVRQIGEAGERASALTRQLLAFSRKQVLVADVLDLNAVVADTDKMLRRLIGEDIDLRISAGAGLWQVKADGRQMEQVLLNLAVNARDAMPRGGTLLIETRNTELDDAYAQAHPYTRPGEYVQLAVSDTGSGMDEATKARIFEPFFTTKGPEKGTGLGLATVYGIVKQHGGSIEVYSEPGRGTAFKIYLPRCREGVRARKSSAGLSLLRRGTETVLLAEDEEKMRALCRMALQKNGYTVLEARNGAEALALCERHPGTIDLLLTDVVMPQLGGRDLYERLAHVRPGLKVLFMSGYTEDTMLLHGVLTQEVPFLQKPFTPDVLLAKLRAVLDQTE